MEVKTMTIEEMEARKAEIAQLVDTDDADLNALDEEVRAINAEMESRKADEAKRAEIRNAVAAGAGEVIHKIEKEDRAMNNAEIRNSSAYVDAFANYIKTGDDRECRALLTENVSGNVPVPELVDQIVHHAWENEEILRRCRRINIRGNFKAAFERSADAAYAHTEGTTAVTEESLTLGIVTMIPKNIKKWIRVSDETMALGGEPFLRYIYEELAYQITKKLVALVINDIKSADTSHSSTAVGIPAVSVAPSVTAIPKAVANLSDEATDVVVIMNRLSEVAFVEAYAAGNFAVDPFAGLPRLYTSALPAYDTAEATNVYMIVGDLKGETINFPEGDGLVIKYDDLSEAEADLVKIVGRQYAAHAVTGPGRFVNVTKPSAVTT
jgi:HK97 family phage major capsid protein